MTTANASCPLAIAPATIAAWRDGALPGDESARIAAHVSGCEACRREIALYESLDDALRRQPVPQSDGRLWRAVRAGMDNAHRSRNTRWTVRRVAGAMGALAAVLLLALGFAQLFQARGDGAAPTVTSSGAPTLPPTATRGKPLTWQPGNLPVTLGENSSDHLTFAVASTDGATAYACYAASGSEGSWAAIYRTSDRAIHWTYLTQFTLLRFQIGDCQVQVDALERNRVLVGVSGMNTEKNQVEQRYELTEDGGATWTQLATNDGLYGIATVNGRTYALQDQVVGKQPDGFPLIVRRLAVSTDHLQNWQPIDQNLIGHMQEVEQFWMQPDGEILVNVRPLDAAGSAYWASQDGGVHWKPFAFPAITGSAPYQIIIAPPSATVASSWRICAGYAPKNGEVIGSILCTLDGGHNWTTLRSLCTQAPCRSSNINPAVGGALTKDNSIIVGALAPGSKDHYGLYRLAPDSGQWRYLGPLTGIGGFFYAPTSDGGVLWQYTGGTYIDVNLSGSIYRDIEGTQTLPPVLATTAYP